MLDCIICGRCFEPSCRPVSSKTCSTECSRMLKVMRRRESGRRHNARRRARSRYLNDLLYIRVCRCCGIDISHRSKQTRYCSKACCSANANERNRVLTFERRVNVALKCVCCGQGIPTNKGILSKVCSAACKSEMASESKAKDRLANPEKHRKLRDRWNSRRRLGVGALRVISDLGLTGSLDLPLGTTRSVDPIRRRAGTAALRALIAMKLVEEGEIRC